MFFLTTLLLIVGVSVAVAAGAIGFSYALGQFLYAQEAGGPVFRSSVDCARCTEDAEWYAALPAWKQALVSGWWLTNRVLYAAKGCR